MNQRFQDKVAIITGGADGIGKGIAEQIASEGGQVVLFDINHNLLPKTVQSFKERGYATEGYHVDISDEKAVQQTLQQVEHNLGKIDIMVNAAGIIGPTGTRIIDYPLEAFEQVYAVNLRGSFIMTKYVLPSMIQQNYGRILLIASIAGKEGNPNMVGYSVTKAGVIGLVKAIGKEYAETGITINGLAPAVIKTAFNDNTAPGIIEYMLSKIPMKRMGTIEEVAALSSWIVSDECSFTTGFVFDCSGGRATY
ncbi:MAG: SDR family oxidoreductase [Bacteroidota bacterium]|nr:SDR family oxidoreductase [Bacteroidota bacterium]